MRAVIVGCGRVGAGLADTLARAGHDVTIVDLAAGQVTKKVEVGKGPWGLAVVAAP